MTLWRYEENFRLGRYVREHGLLLPNHWWYLKQAGYGMGLYYDHPYPLYDNPLYPRNQGV